MATNVLSSHLSSPSSAQAAAVDQCLQELAKEQPQLLGRQKRLLRPPRRLEDWQHVLGPLWMQGNGLLQ
jgi:hypothetical protein